MTDATQKALEAARDCIKAADEELRLIRMKDCGVIYDTTLRSLDIPLALAKIDAALSALDAIPEVKVRELEWVGNDPNCFRSYKALYEYVVTHDGDEPDEWSVRRNGKLISFHDTEKAASAAAQADYERRIRSALVPPESRS